MRLQHFFSFFISEKSSLLFCWMWTRCATTSADQSCRHLNNVVRENIFISTNEFDNHFPQQFPPAQGSPTKTRSGPKRTFQDPLLAVFVILSKHVTGPRKSQVSCATDAWISLYPDDMVLKQNARPGFRRDSSYRKRLESAVMKTYVIVYKTYAAVPSVEENWEDANYTGPTDLPCECAQACECRTHVW